MKSIDRQALVRRHNPLLRSFDPESPLSVGNGELAFTVDCTGLQTFPGLYEKATPLCTQSQWGWHSFPGQSPQELLPRLRLEQRDSHGRRVGYASSSEGQEGLFDAIRRNPHRLNLARIGLKESHQVSSSEVTDIRQSLDLWSGILDGRFRILGREIHVRTSCHPRVDAVAVRVESNSDCPCIELRFPYGSPEMNASDWASSSSHESRVTENRDDLFEVTRIMDGTRYYCRLHLCSGERVTRTGDHCSEISGQGRLEVVVEFSPSDQRSIGLSCAEVEAESSRQWERYWTEGGCLDLSDSSDNCAQELERRIVLSQYLTAIQCAGTLPPQETGLTCNSWYGKFHTEMHYWHSAHFILWNRPHMLERSLPWYGSVRGRAAERARSQGYHGIRRPKMTGPEGIDSPSPIGPLLIWQQPHIITLAELLYRYRGDAATLEHYGDLVFDTAEFMASFAHWNPEKDRFELGPWVIPAQECHFPDATVNPTFELEYWDFGLRVAIQWRQRLGLPVEPRWEDVVSKLSALPRARDDDREVYLAHERCPDTFRSFNRDHPSMLAAFGMLPGRKCHAGVMNATLDRVLSGWDFDNTWGWDFPMIAMTATRLRRPDDAVDALLMDQPKNTYLLNGHNPQRPKKELPVYLPGNGALLLAAALMAAGWVGCTDPCPGFPGNGKWSVRFEMIRAT